MIGILVAPLRMLDVRTAGLARLPLGALLTVASAIVWYVFVTRGVCFPLAVPDPKTSWGGPTMAGAWSVHFALLAAILAALHGTAYVLRPKAAR
jgi:hypothetical protein